MKMSFQNLWGAVKAELRGRVLVPDMCIWREERSNIHCLSFNFGNQIKKDKLNPEEETLQKPVQKSVKLKTGNQQRKTNKTKSWSFEKINKMDTPLAGLSRKKNREDAND